MKTILNFIYNFSSIFHLQNAYFDIEYHKFEQKVGDRDHFADISKIKIRKINGTKDRGLFGPVIVHGPIDDSFLWHTSLYVKQGGEYRLHPFKIPTEEFCKGINNDLHFVPGVAEKSNLTLPMPCPIINVVQQFSFRAFFNI